MKMSKNCYLEATQRPVGFLSQEYGPGGGQSSEFGDRGHPSSLSAPCLSCSGNTQLALLPLVTVSAVGTALATPSQGWAAHGGVIQQGHVGATHVRGSRLQAAPAEPWVPLGSCGQLHRAFSVQGLLSRQVGEMQPDAL